MVPIIPRKKEPKDARTESVQESESPSKSSVHLEVIEKCSNAFKVACWNFTTVASLCYSSVRTQFVWSKVVLTKPCEVKKFSDFHFAMCPFGAVNLIFLFFFSLMEPKR